VLSEHTAVTGRTCRIAHLKVAADKIAFALDKEEKDPDLELFINFANFLLV